MLFLLLLAMSVTRSDLLSLKQWVRQGELHGSAVLPMGIGLKQPNLDNGHGHALLEEV